MQYFGGTINFSTDNGFFTPSNPLCLNQQQESKFLNQGYRNNQVDFIAVKNCDNKHSVVDIFNDENSDLIIMGEIRIYNDLELENKLNVKNLDNHRLVLEAYKKWGIDCPKYLNGDFSFVIWNPIKQEVFCVRDHMGQKPFYYSFEQEIFTFSTRFQFVHQNYRDKLKIDHEWVALFLMEKYPAKEQTIFEKIKRLSPGHSLLIKNGKKTIQQYWDLENSSKNSSKNFIEGLKEEIHRSVKMRLKNSTSVGVELSGGLDSSLITAILKNETDNTLIIDTYSNKLTEESKVKYPEFYDEWNKASMVASHLNIKNHFAFEKPISDPIKLIDLTLEIHGLPSIFNFSVLQKGIYDSSCERNNELLYSGFGGDELVSERTFSRYTWTVKKKDGYKGLVKYYRGQGETLVRSYIKTMRFFKNSFLKTDNRNKKIIFKRQWANNVLKDQIITSKSIKLKVFEQSSFPANQSLKERALSNNRKSSLTERLETGYSFTNDVDLNYTLPLLDVPLMEYYFGLPDHYKAENPSDRFLFREICKDLLPSEIVNQKKPTNAYTIPFQRIEVINEMQNLITYCLAIPVENAIFNYVDRVKLTRLIDTITQNDDVKKYKIFQNVIMLSRFFDKHLEQIKF